MNSSQQSILSNFLTLPIWYIKIVSHWCCCFFKIDFWLHWVFVAACGLSLVVASGGLVFVAVLWLLIAVVSLVVEHGL